MKIVWLGAAAVLALGGTAHAQRLTALTGDGLVRLCSSSDQKQVEACTAYINGVADAAEFYQRLRPADASKGGTLPGYVCVPGSTTGITMRAKVVDYLRAHSAEGGRQASGIVLRGLDEAFPCANKQPRLP